MLAKTLALDDNSALYDVKGTKRCDAPAVRVDDLTGVPLGGPVISSPNHNDVRDRMQQPQQIQRPEPETRCAVVLSTQSVSLAQRLKAARVKVLFHAFDRAGHGIMLPTSPRLKQLLTDMTQFLVAIDKS